MQTPRVSCTSRLRTPVPGQEAIQTHNSHRDTTARSSSHILTKSDGQVSLSTKTSAVLKGTKEFIATMHERSQHARTRSICSKYSIAPSRQSVQVCSTTLEQWLVLERHLVTPTRSRNHLLRGSPGSVECAMYWQPRTP